jgi:hypothetical protein
MRRNIRDRARSSAVRRRPALEALEARTVLSNFTVTNLHDSGTGSLRQAILDANAAPGADVIKFAGGLRGTIPLTSGELSITDDLKIHGPGANKVTVSGGATSRDFHVSGSGTHLAIDNLTIADGLVSVPAGSALGGGLLNEGSSVSLEKVVFANNRAVGLTAGGGAVANLGGQFTADHTGFVGNTAQSADGQDAFGGAVYNDQGTVVSIDHAEFSTNMVIGGNANGGAIGALGGSQVTIDHSSFDSNQADGDADDGATGGAIAVQRIGLIASAPSTMTVSRSSFTGNQALVHTAAAGADVNGQGNGGAIDLEDGSTLTVSQSVFDSNSAQGGAGGAGSAGSDGGAGGASFGGAINNFSATLVVSHSQFTGNETRGGQGGAGGAGGSGGGGAFGLGGGIAATALTTTNVPPETTIDHCVFAGNQAFGGSGGPGGSGGNGGSGDRCDGGGVINLIGTMTVDHCSIDQNATHGGAGGAAGSGAGTVGGDGGLTRGGGFSNERGGTATLTQTTITNNQATGGTGATGGNGGDALGGGVFNGRPAGVPPDPARPANLTLDHCTVSGNEATGGAGGPGGNGGNGFGGGIFNGNPVPVAGTPILTLLGTTVTHNEAQGGAAGAGGTDGLGEGGGLYNQFGARAFVDKHTKIKGNKASTSGDEIFGIVTPD